MLIEFPATLIIQGHWKISATDRSIAKSIILDGILVAGSVTPRRPLPPSPPNPNSFAAFSGGSLVPIYTPG